MNPQLPVDPRAIVERAREAITGLRPAATEGRRSLPIRRPADDLRRLWSDADARAAVLNGIPAADASLDFGPELADWGTTVSVHLRLETAVPGVATQALAGKVLRRLKALAETGEVPTTDRNPSYRPDAGEQTA
jgi:hypothetical protein